jgi:hypothetical protein
MRKATMVWAVLLLALPGVLGCASKNKGKIEGTKWTSQAATFTDKRTGRPASLAAGTMGLEFRTDGTMVYRVQGQQFPGRYSLGMGNSVTFNMDEDVGGKGKMHVEKVVIRGNVLTMTDTDGTTLSFDKQ